MCTSIYILCKKWTEEKEKLLENNHAEKKTIFEEKHQMLTIPDEKRAAMIVELRQTAGKSIKILSC